jgi:DNA-directed RNA polymerase subunit H
MVDEKKDSGDEMILSHNYNPTFELLSEDEASKLLNDLNIKSSLELPKMAVNDPIAKLFKAKPNDIFKITRKSYTAGESIFYRVIIDE